MLCVKIIAILVVVLATMVPCYEAFHFHYNQGCRVQQRKRAFTKRWRLTMQSLALAALCEAAFWQELVAYCRSLQYGLRGDFIFINTVTMLTAALAYYELLVMLVLPKLTAKSLEKAQAKAQAQVQKCQQLCLQAEPGARMRLHCRSLDDQACPCAENFNIHSEIELHDVQQAVRRMNMRYFGSTIIRVPVKARYVCRPAVIQVQPGTQSLPTEVEQAYIEQILRLAAAKALDKEPSKTTTR